MGIRVHKKLGFGLTDCQYWDPRINRNGYLHALHEEQENNYTINGYLDFFREYDGENSIDYLLTKKMISEQEKPPEIYECIEYDCEFSDPQVLIITPPTSLDTWQRYDDIIDFIEETRNYEQSNRYQIFEFGIFPYEGTFCDKHGNLWKDKDGIPYSRVAQEFIKTKRQIIQNKENEEQLFLLLDRLSYFSRYLGFDNINEAVYNVLPLIPKEVKVLCKYMKLFNDDNMIYQLKPMLYVYWS